MNRRLKLMRIVVSVCCLEMITCTLVGILPSSIGSVLIQMQLMHLVLFGALGWIALWLVFSMIFGRLYCSTVCPMGTLIDILARITRGKTRYQYVAPNNALRYGTLAIVAVCISLPLSFVTDVIDPDSAYAIMVWEFVYPIVVTVRSALGMPPVYVTAASALGLIVAIVILAVMTVFARKGGRTFCNTFCPAGAILSLVSRNAIFHIDINTDVCTHCGKCEDVCKAQCITHQQGAVDMSRCVVCFNCTSACNDGAISYTTRRHRLSTPMLQRMKGVASVMQMPEPTSVKHEIENKNETISGSSSTHS